MDDVTTGATAATEATAYGIKPVISVIICTRTHVNALRPTLESMAKVDIPADMPAELVVVDNGSTDDTRQAVEEARLPGFVTVRYVYEPRTGACFARNAGLAVARGEIILFTDDDLYFPKDWIDGMCRPILSGEADAIAGGVVLASYLQRPWMTTMHRSWLASTEALVKERPLPVGANMAFTRRTLEKVPAFDTELGPGQLGFCDDSLFAEQLWEAGFRIQTRLGVQVEHHCDASRLQREFFLTAAEKHGRSAAYVTYHWHHTHTFNLIPLRLLKAKVTLALKRLLRGGEIRNPEGAPNWELEALFFQSFLRQTQREMQRPCLYEKRGLVKREQTTQ